MQDKKFTKFENLIWKDRNIKGNEKLVLFYLISYYNESLGYSFPKRKQIQEATGIAKDTLNKVLDSLEAKGYITRANNPKKGGRNNIYYIHKYLVIKSKNDVSEGPKQVKPDAKICESINESCETDAKTSSIEGNKENGSSTPEAPADANIVENIEVVEASTNELLVKQKAKVIRQLNNDEIEEINKLDTDLLIKAIERANSYKPNGYHIGYILKTYESVKGGNTENNPPVATGQGQNIKSTNNLSNDKKSTRGANKSSTVKTKFHDTFNEHFRKYPEDELEEKLLKIQAAKRAKKEV